MKLAELLALIQEINKTLTLLQAIGLKIDGHIDLPTILALFNPKSA